MGVSFLRQSDSEGPTARFVSPMPARLLQANPVDQAELADCLVPAGPHLSSHLKTPQLLDCSELVLHKIISLLTADDITSMRLVSRRMASICSDLKIPAWQELLAKEIQCATHADDVLARIQRAARQGILQHAKALALSDKNLVDAHLQPIMGALAAGEQSAFLQRLDLRNNGISNAGAQALASATHLTSLQWLDVSFNRLGCAGVQLLALAENLSCLQHLNLRGNAIDEIGAQALSSARHLTAPATPRPRR